MTNPVGTTILTKTFPGVLDANGNGIATGGPAVNEYWLPLTIRVATKTKATPVPACTVFIGSAGAYDFTTYIDDTALGSQDTTSMCSGVIVQFGENISAQWAGGNPGDNVVLIVTGIVSNVPPSIGWLPQVPGTHFSGHIPPEISTVASFKSLSTPVSINPNQTIYISQGGSSTIPDDVRQYESYYLKVFSTTPGNATAFNPIQVQIQFYGKPDTTGGTIIFQDNATWWSDSPGGGFAVFLGPVEIQDEMHGPYMTVGLLNQAATDTVNVNYILEYTTRRVNSPFMRQQAGLNGVLVSQDSNTGAGNLVDLLLPLMYGEAWAYCLAGANTITPTIGLGNGLGTFRNIFPGASGAVASGASNQQRIVLPKVAGHVQIVGGVANTGYNFSLISNLSKV